MRCATASQRVRAIAGFTLVELMVALVAMALLAVMSWRGIDGMTRARELTETRANELGALQIALAQWNADLDSIVQLPQYSGLDWNGRVLRVIRRGTASASDGLRVAAWTQREGRWMRWQSDALITRSELETAWLQAEQWAQNPGVDLRRREVSLLPLQQWQIFYFRGNSWTNPLSSDATGNAGTTVTTAGGQRINVLPDGVRLVLDLPGGQVFSGTLTRDWVNPTHGGGKS